MGWNDILNYLNNTANKNRQTLQDMNTTGLDRVQMAMNPNLSGPRLPSQAMPSEKAYLDSLANGMMASMGPSKELQDAVLQKLTKKYAGWTNSGLDAEVDNLTYHIKNFEKHGTGEYAAEGLETKEDLQNKLDQVQKVLNNRPDDYTPPEGM